MAIHSSTLAWRIPGIGEPGGLPSMRSHRVGHDWSDLAAANNWMPSPTWWTWVWTRTRSCQWTGKPGAQQSMGSQSQTWLSNWTDWKNNLLIWGIWYWSLSILYTHFKFYFLCVSKAKSKKTNKQTKKGSSHCLIREATSLWLSWPSTYLALVVFKIPSNH